MRTSFIHLADVRLGYRDIEYAEAFEQLAGQFRFAVDFALEQRAAFVLFAGNLFDSPNVDPETFQVVLRGLTRLRDRNVPALAILGRHELGEPGASITWYDLLSQEGLLVVLDAYATGGRLSLGAWDKREGRGSFYDLSRCRLFGLRYFGSMTGMILGDAADAIGQLDNREMDFRILLLQASLEHLADRRGGRLSYSELLAVQRHMDYVALGGCDSTYEADGWAYNPGCAGLFHVTVDTAVKPKHTARFVAFPNGPASRRPATIDQSPSRESIEAQILEELVIAAGGSEKEQRIRGDVVRMASHLVWNDADPDDFLNRLLDLVGEPRASA